MPAEGCPWERSMILPVNPSIHTSVVVNSPDVAPQRFELNAGASVARSGPRRNDFRQKWSFSLSVIGFFYRIYRRPWYVSYINMCVVLQ